MSDYENLDRLRRNADEAVGVGYQVVQGWVFIFAWMATFLIPLMVLVSIFDSVADWVFWVWIVLSFFVASMLVFKNDS